MAYLGYTHVSQSQKVNYFHYKLSAIYKMSTQPIIELLNFVFYFNPCVLLTRIKFTVL